MARVLGLLALIAALSSAPAAAGRYAATALGLAETAAGATVRLTLDGRPAFDSFTLTRPDRVVLDFPEIDWRAAPPPPAGLVAGLRFGLAAPGRSRLVIDLAGPARVASARYEPGPDGEALVVTLTPVAREPFEDAAGWPPGLGPLRPKRRGATAPPVIALDPGHGGADGGAARAGMVEKEITLAFARALAPRLRAAGFAVTLTRDGDVFVPLAERVRRAEAAGADLLLSLHADVVLRGEASGVSVYTLSEEASDAEAAALAERANAVDGLAGLDVAGAGGDVARALVGLVRAETMAASARLGATLVDAFGARVPLLSGRPLRSAGFRVLKSPVIPSALIELGFLSSAEDRARLADPAWRRRAVEAIVAAATRWAGATAPRRAAGTVEPAR